MKNILNSIKRSSSLTSKSFAVLVSVILIASMLFALGSLSAQSTQFTGTETTHGGSPSQTGYIGPTTDKDPTTGLAANYTVLPIAFLSCSPNPVGAGQILLVNMWITFPAGEGKFMNGYTVTVKHPDGTSGTVVLQSYVADGTAYFDYVPTVTGLWQFQMSFPGEYFPAGFYGNGVYETTPFIDSTGAAAIYNPSDYVAAATSDWINVTVQQAQVASWDGLEYAANNYLPASYWTHPIEPNNRGWATIAGNFPFYESNIAQLQATNSWHDEWYGPFVPAVNTAHILWSTIGTLSGVVGGELGAQSNVGTPGPTTPFDTPSIIYMGRCYETVTKSINGGPVQQYAECYNLQTGQIIYDDPYFSSSMTAAQAVGTNVTPTYLMYWNGVDLSVPGSAADAAAIVDAGAIVASQGGYQLYRINLVTGAITTNVTTPFVQRTGTVVAGPPGAPTVTQGAVSDIPSFCFYDGYFLSFQWRYSTITSYDGVNNLIIAYNGYMVNWTEQGAASGATFSNSIANGGRIADNISVTLPESFRTIYEPNFGYGYGAYDPVTGISITENRFIYGGFYGSFWEATSFVNSTTPIGGSATVLWNITTPNDPNDMVDAYRPTNGWCRDGIYAYEMERGFIQARNEYTGVIMWNTTTEDATTGQSYPWGEFWMYDEAAYGFGNNALLYAVGYAGVYALNETSGAIVWHYNDVSVPFETPYTDLENGTYVNEYSVQDIRVVGSGGSDGIVYVSNNEHTPTLPPERGWGLIALNATTGGELWKVDGTRMQVAAASDGYLVTSSNYDGKVYVLGKGPSATTVSVPQVGIAANTPVMISGTVLDQSPNQPGTPCISDASMSTWMDYLNMQMPIGGIYNNITIYGVPVTLYAVNPNGGASHAWNG